MVVVEFHRPPDPTTTPPPTTTTPPTTAPADFCTLYRAMIDNALATADLELEEWSGEIARRLREMRSVVPAQLAEDLETMIVGYEAWAAGLPDIDVVIDAAVANPDFEEAISAYCGVEPLG
jgi:hypothetical protein